MTNKENITNLKSRYGDMYRRCYHPKSCNYKHYGARGITVCDEWVNDRDSFVDWALQNGYKKELSLDRIDNEGNYEPSNCRWTDRRTQNINKRSPTPSSTGFVGVCVHSSSYEGHTYYYGRVRDRTGKTMYTGMSQVLKEAVLMRNNFIILNGLDNELNVIPNGMVD